MRYSPKLPDDLVNTPNSNFLRDFFKWLFLLVILFVFAFLLLTWSIDKIVEALSPEQEKYISSSLKTSLYKEAKPNQYLQDVLDRLTPCIDLPYKVKVYTVDKQEPNAFAMLGGDIYVTSGLIKELDSENELAFILGHELGHFKHKDHLRQMGYGVLLLGAMALIGESIDLNFGNTLISFGGAKYSQKAELRADMTGIKSVICAYGNAAGTLHFFKKQAKDSPWEYFGATHPDFQTRIDRIESHIKSNHIDTTAPLVPLKSKPL